jgi:hypothetical protein
MYEALLGIDEILKVVDDEVLSAQIICAITCEVIELARYCGSISV